MSTLRTLGLILAFSGAALPGVAWAADAPAAANRAPARSFVATGPSTPADLARLREALARVPGVVSIEVRAAPDGAVLSIQGEANSLLAAAARSVGFLLRPAPARSFAAAGPTGEADLAKLRRAMGEVPGVDQVEVGRHAPGAALRVTGVATTAALSGAGKSAGFTLRQLGSYVASGPSSEADLGRLRSALVKTAGVEEVEMRGLTGGSTLLIYGDVQDALLTRAARAAGFALWPLAEARGGREFRIAGAPGPAEQQKLLDALRSVEGIGEIEIRMAPDGPRLVVSGGRVRPERIKAAATEAGFALSAVETVALPSLTPDAGRNTPPDYDERVLEDLSVRAGDPAPDFTLLAMDEQKFRLSDYLGKRPVVLLFGSCT